MRATAPRLLVFTDLDGTLLDRETYSWLPAKPCLDELARRKVPVIFTTSKTLAEVRRLRREMGVTAPFIVENGAAAVLPDPPPFEVNGVERADEFLIRRFGSDRTAITALLRKLREERGYRFESFADWSPAQLAKLANLSLSAAEAALDRTASEPLAWNDTAGRLEVFRDQLESQGLSLVQGGRFWHVMGRFDKADAVVWLRDRYREGNPAADFFTVALGDSPNDLGMLEAASLAVVIPSQHSGNVQPVRAPETLRASRPGPEGWREAMERILARFPEPAV